MVNFSAHKYPLIIVCLIVIFSPQNSFSQIKISHFDELTRYTAEDGLLSTYSTDIQEDKYGFLWIATSNGVSRFDGSHFTNYEYFFKNSVAHKFGFINSLKIDNTGQTVYVSTDVGVFKTSVDTVKFNIIHGTINVNKRVNDILFDEQNNAWLASTSGLVKLSADTDKKNIFPFGNSFKLNQLQCLVRDSKNPDILWIGTLGGLVRFNVISKTYESSIFDNKIELAENHIRKIAVSDKEIFLGTWSAGLVVFNKETHQFTQPLESKYPNAHNTILEIYNDNNSNLWITSDSGIFHYDTHLNDVIKIQNHNFKKNIIRGVSFIDSRGVIWFGYKNGLFKYHSKPYKSHFLELEPRAELETPLLVKEIIPYNNSVYVAGQYSKGLYELDKNDNLIKTIKIPPFKYFDKKGYLIMDMVLMHTKNILLISSDKIAIFNPNTKKTTLSPLQVNHPNPSFQTVVKDNNNNYWIGSREGGLFCLNFEDNTIKNYKEEFNIYKDKNYRWVSSLYIDSENKLWIGKGSANAIIDLNDLSIHLFNPENETKIYKNVRGFYEDAKKKIWMVNDSKGIGYTDIKKFDKKTTHKVNGSFYGIYKHNDSLLWTTGSQLGELNINNMSYKPIELHVDRKGLKIRGPIVNYTNDTYLIGSNNGVIIYNPIKKDINYKIPQPYVRKIVGNGKTLYEENDLNNKELSFESKTNYLIFSISSLGFNKQDQTTYQYKIQDDWIDLAKNQEIYLTNLTQGSYSLKIKACNAAGNCSTTPVSYNFTILTSWYKSWWAYTLYAIFIWTIGVLLYKFNLNRKIAVAEKQKAIEFDELKSKMYANISHEFRTPLTLINGLSKVLIEQGFEEEDVEKLKGINHNGNQLLHLVNQMLELVSFDAHKATVSYKNADIIKFIEKCVSFYKFYADSKEVQLIFSSGITALKMDFDDDKLQKILNNILSNAIKFTPKKGIVTIEIDERNQYLILKISDTGQGIEPEHVPHIFERHYKTFDVNNNLGNGIGMALTKELVDILKGTISVESTLEKGSVFTIKLPVKNTIKKSDTIVHQIPFIEHSKTKIEAINSENENTKATILLVEDNKEIQNFIKLLLGNLYTILIANNGIEGLEIVKKTSVDFIISDVIMPKMDGYEFCKHIKNNMQTSHIPFIMVTAKSAIDDKLKGYKLGIDAYLLKPFNKEELLLIIKNLLLKQQEKITYFSKLLELKKQHTKVANINQLDIDFIKSIQEIALSPHKLSIENITEKLAVSRTQLHKKIKALTGKSITHYINYIRIEKAKTLLTESTLQINEIAFELGFESANYFTRTFKKETGKTPFSYREKPLL